MAQRKTFALGGSALRIAPAAHRFYFRNRHSANVRICTRVASPRPRRVLVARWRPFDAKERKPVPVGAGDGIGNGGERLVSPAVPLESIHECRNGMAGVLPLPDHLRAGFN